MVIYLLNFSSSFSPSLPPTSASKPHVSDPQTRAESLETPSFYLLTPVSFSSNVVIKPVLLVRHILIIVYNVLTFPISKAFTSFGSFLRAFKKPSMPGA